MCLLNCVQLCDSMDCSLPGSCPWDFPGKILEWVAISYSREYLPLPGTETASLTSPALQAGSLLLSHWENIIHIYYMCIYMNTMTLM